MIDELNDNELLALAIKRLANNDINKLITAAEHKEKYGITEETLQGYEEVELE